MDKEQLRIGNIVGRKFWNPNPSNPSFEYAPCIICAIGENTALVKDSESDKSRLKISYDLLEPIEITEGWLDKLGFKTKGLCKILEVQPFKILSFSDTYLHIIDNYGDYDADIVTLWNKDLGKKFYVHELQNIISIFR